MSCYVTLVADAFGPKTLERDVLQALLSLAKLDADAVWLLLQLHAVQTSFQPNPDGTIFPDAQGLVGHDDSIRASQGARSTASSALLYEVDRMRVCWHFC